jgi:hypothetical protein
LLLLSGFGETLLSCPEELAGSIGLYQRSSLSIGEMFRLGICGAVLDVTEECPASSITIVG